MSIFRRSRLLTLGAASHATPVRTLMHPSARHARILFSPMDGEETAFLHPAFMKTPRWAVLLDSNNQKGEEDAVLPLPRFVPSRQLRVC